MLNCEIKVKDSKVDIAKRIEQSLPSVMEIILKRAQEIALKNKRGEKSNDCILFEITIQNGCVSGRLYTNFDYALFLEYGTGTLAEMPHIGHTETFKNSGYTYWYLPKRIADERGQSFNPNRLISIKGKWFYIMYPTKPYPFMRPTTFELENNVLAWFTNALKEKLNL